MISRGYKSTRGNPRIKEGGNPRDQHNTSCKSYISLQHRETSSRQSEAAVIHHSAVEGVEQLGELKQQNQKTTSFDECFLT